MISPAQGNVPANVHMEANGYGPAKITAMQVYVDNQLRYQANAANVDTMLTLTRGGHSVVFQGWDSTGATWKSGTSITVP